MKVNTPAEDTALPDERSVELRTQLAEAADRVRTGTDWIRVLLFAERFADLGFHAALLIADGHPQTTRVATYEQWQQAGRQVQRGERGITVPVSADGRVARSDGARAQPRSARPKDASARVSTRNAGRDRSRDRREATRASHAPARVTVFDITQTGGRPDRSPLALGLLRTLPPGVLDALADLAVARGYYIGHDTETTAFTDHRARRIHLPERSSGRAELHALTHELGHILMRRPDAGTGQGDEYGRDGSCVLADSVAFMVLTHVGLDVAPYLGVLPDVAVWAGSDPRAQPRQAILSAGRQITAAARELTAAVDAAVLATELNDLREQAERSERDALAAAMPDLARHLNACDTELAAAPTTGPQRARAALTAATVRAAMYGAAGDADRHRWAVMFEGHQTRCARLVEAWPPCPHCAGDRNPALDLAQPIPVLTAQCLDCHASEDMWPIHPHTAAHSAGPADQYGQGTADLLSMHAEVERFYTDNVAASWVPGHLAGRGLGAALDQGAPWGIGYAPTGPTTLIDHLRAAGHSDERIAASGLAQRAKDGGLIDRFRDRLMIPIRDPAGTTIAFIGRASPEVIALRRQTPKYLNSPQTALYRKSDVLYGLDTARAALADGKRPVIVEGPLDAIACQLAGVPAVAPCGTALTRPQVALLDHACPLARVGVVAAFDGDDAGRRAASAAHPLLAEFTAVPVAAVFPDGADPATLLRDRGAAGLRTLVTDHARPLIHLVVDTHLDDTRDRPAWDRRNLAADKLATLIRPSIASQIAAENLPGPNDQPDRQVFLPHGRAIDLLGEPIVDAIASAAADLGAPFIAMLDATVDAISEATQRPKGQRDPRPAPRCPGRSTAALDTPTGATRGQGPRSSAGVTRVPARPKPHARRR